MKTTYRPALTRNIGRWTLYLMGLLGTLLVLSLAGSAYRSWRTAQLVAHLSEVNQATQALFNAADQLVHEQVYTRILLSQLEPPGQLRLHRLSGYRLGVDQSLPLGLKEARVDPGSAVPLAEIEDSYQALRATRELVDRRLNQERPSWDESLLQQFTINSANLLDKVERLMVQETRTLSQTDSQRIERLVAVGLNAWRMRKHIGQSGSGVIIEANRQQPMPQADLLLQEAALVRAQASTEQLYDNAVEVRDARLSREVRALLAEAERFKQINVALAVRRRQGERVHTNLDLYEKTVLDTIGQARQVHDLARSMIGDAFAEQSASAKSALRLNLTFVLLGLALSGTALALLRSRVLQPLVRLQLILDVATDAIITLDSGLAVRMLNKGAERLFETTLAKELWSSIDTLLALKPTQREALQRLTLEPGEFRGDTKARRGDKWINVSLTAAPIQVGNETGLLLIIRDVHARKLVEESLSRSLKLIRTISSLQNRIFTQSQRGDVYRELLQVLLEHTDSRYGFIGLVREPIVGRACVVVDEMIGGSAPPAPASPLHRTGADEAQQVIALDALVDLAVLMREPVCFQSGDSGLELLAETLALEPGTLANFMLLPVMVKGLLVAVVGIGQREHGYSSKLASEIDPLLGAYAGMVAYFHEEDAKRLSEQHLQQVSQQQAAIFSTSPVGLMIVRDYRVLRANSAASEMFGGFEEGLVGWRLNELLVNEEDTSRLIALLELSAQESQSDALELQCMRAGSVPFWARLHARPLDAQRPELGFVMAVIDMTDQKQTEAMLRRAKEAAIDASQAKSAFLATMSHEIRTPMNGVIGMLELLSLSRLDAEQKDTLDTAQTSARSLLRLIDEILDFSKIEAGRLEIVPEITSLPEIALRVQQLHLENASRKGLALVTLLDPAVHPVVLADEFRLTQILNNFVSNAIKFTLHGEVGIALNLVQKDAERQTVRFEVVDSGIGMSAEGIQRLFEPFTQAESDTTRRFGGTGLGLAICKRLAELMGGRVEIESELGRGTTVSLLLTVPLAAPEALAEAAPKPGAAAAVVALQQPELPVLFAEDNPTNRKLIAKQLNLLGLEVVTAEDGVDALEKWHAGQYALLLTDCHMPHMNGYQLAGAIREIEKEEQRAHTLIIACTANAAREEAEQCLAAGMDDFLTKPLTIGKLSQTLAKWLGAAEPSAQQPAPPESAPPRSEPPLLLASEDSVQALDRAQLAVYSDGDLNIELEILREFWSSNSEDVSGLRVAYAEWDFAGLVKWAHRIKGAARMIGAEPLGSAAQGLEEAGKQQDRALFEARLLEFNGELDRLAFALAELGVLPADVS